ncbi:AraC family transcriptional regulator [Pseudomonas sp. MRSN 12121]|uniref:AraC family transcriptional regulator n=1 Tax=Pseudomonas sp. MRSN 12121 TaxID=1611770 RepID=UPI0005BEF590|nr:AraC family transcriptional regulator [Pseudomonas sp. MRSN 12121]AJO78301.1 hypothetical protein TO66_13720 [Pseudomonas sp. MRSN 12121]
MSAASDADTLEFLRESLDTEPEGLSYSPQGITQMIHRPLPPWGVIECVRVAEQPHRFEMRRSQHQFVLYHQGAVSDGEVSIDGQRMAGARMLDQVIDFVPAGVVFEGWTGERARIGYVLVSIDDEQLSEISPAYQPQQNLNPLISCHDVFLRGLLERLYRVTRAAGTETLYLESLVMLLMYEVCKLQQLPDNLPASDGMLGVQQRQRLDDYIRSALASDVRLADMSNVVNLSPYHFSRVFRRSYGMSPYQYLLHCRIERAKALISTSDRSLLQIALDTGFAGASQFSRTFRRIVGLAPSELRRP